jgi:hypothetical protein
MSIINFEIKKSILWYVIALFFVSWSIQILAILIVGNVNKNSAGLWLVLTMVSPFFVTLFFLYKNEEWK